MLHCAHTHLHVHTELLIAAVSGQRCQQHYQSFSGVLSWFLCLCGLSAFWLSFITCQLYFISGGKPCLSSSYLLLWADHKVFWGQEQEAGRINLNNKWRMIITNFKICFCYFSYMLFTQRYKLIWCWDCKMV